MIFKFSKKIKIFIFGISFFSSVFSAIKTFEDVLSDYGVISFEKISEGHEKNVYAVTKINGTKEACLCFKNDVKRPARSKERFDKEFDFLDAADHNNIIRKHEHIIYKGLGNISNYIIFTELADSDLHTYLKEKKPSSKKKIKILKDIVSGLRYIHSKGFVYCDLKPQNVVVFEDDDEVLAKLIDFSYLKSEGIYNLFQGTVEFIPPITLENYLDFIYGRKDEFRTNLTEKFDIFSLGVLIYELFYSEKIDEAFRKFRMNAGDPLNSCVLDVKNKYCQSYIYSYTDLLKRGRLIGFNKSVNSKINRLIKNCLNADLEKRPTSGKVWQFLDRI